MKPVYQTRFGGRDAPPEKRGDCEAAALASILELPLATVPCFAHLDDEKWVEQRGQWLRQLGFWGLELSPPFEYREGGSWLRNLGYHLMCGVSPRGHEHCCVGFAGEIVHDPHPDGGGLTEVGRVVILIPLDPAVALAGKE